MLAVAWPHTLVPERVLFLLFLSPCPAPAAPPPRSVLSKVTQGMRPPATGCPGAGPPTLSSQAGPQEQRPLPGAPGRGGKRLHHTVSTVESQACLGTSAVPLLCCLSLCIGVGRGLAFSLGKNEDRSEHGHCWGCPGNLTQRGRETTSVVVTASPETSALHSLDKCSEPSFVCLHTWIRFMPLALCPGPPS